MPAEDPFVLPLEAISPKEQGGGFTLPTQAQKAFQLPTEARKQPYDPKVRPGEYPITGPLDIFSQSIAEPAAPIVGALGTAVDTLRRPVATLIAGQGIGKAFQNTFVTPNEAPTPEDTKHTLGIGEIQDKPGFDPEGNVNWWNVLTSKLPNEAANVAVGIGTDPATYLTPGVGPAAKAAKAAKTEAVALRLAGDEAGAAARMASVGQKMPAPFLDRAAENAWIHPEFSQSVAAGQGGIHLHPPHLPIPFVPKLPGDLFLAMPKWMAPAMEKIDFLTKHRELGLLKNPDAAAPMTMADRLTTARAHILASDMLKEVHQTNAMAEQFSVKDPAFVDKTLKALTDIHEQQGRAGELSPPDSYDPRNNMPDPLTRDLSWMDTENLEKRARFAHDTDAMVELNRRRPRGQEWYHGTAHVFDEFSEAKDSGKNLFGPGVYLVGDPDVAFHYAKRAQKLGGELPHVKILDFEPQNVLEMGGDGRRAPKKLFLSGGRILPANEFDKLAQSAADLGMDLPPQRNALLLHAEVRKTYGGDAFRKIAQNAGFDSLGFMHSAEGYAKNPYHVTVALEHKAVREVGTGKHWSEPTATPQEATPKPPTFGQPPDAGFQRGLKAATPEEAATMRALGLTVESGNPFQARADALVNNPHVKAALPTLGTEINKAVRTRGGEQWKGVADPSGQNAGAYEHLSTLSAHDLGVARQILEFWKDSPARLLAKQRSLGLQTPELNFNKITEPSKILDLVDKTNAFGTPSGPPRGKVKILNQSQIEALSLKVEKATKLGQKATLSDIPTSEEVRDLTVALAKKFPQAVREYQSVPNYTPGGLSRAARATRPQPNPNTGHLATDTDIEAQRLSLHGSETGNPNIPGVSKNVALSNLDRARGSAATEGRPVGGQEQGWISKYILPEGLKRTAKMIEDTAPDATMHSNRYDLGMAEEINGPIYQALRLEGPDGLEGMVKRFWKGDPVAALDAVKHEARHGVEVKNAPNRPATLQDLEATFKAAGGVSEKLTDLLGPDALKDLNAGKLALPDAFNQQFNPFNRKAVTLDGKEYYMHGGIAREFEQMKTLGTDPFHMARHLGFIAPVVVWLNNAWKQNATFRGPQFFAYQGRNQIGDMSRMSMIDALDLQTAQDMTRLFGTNSAGKTSFTGGRLAEFVKTGDPAVFKGLSFRRGAALIDGVEAAKEWRRQGLLDSGELQADVLGEYLPKETQGTIDNSWSGMASRHSTAAKAVVGAVESLGDKFKTWGAARENMNRVTAYETRLRAGDSESVAAATVINGLFDFKRLSPAGHFLKQTGLIPFASWHSKVYPMVLKWAIENPGEFVATLRVLDAVRQNEIADSQLPEWMRSKHNMIVRKFRNANGDMEAGVVTSSGILPLQDLRELVDDPSSVVDKFGPILRLAYEAQRMAREEEGRHTAGENAATLGEAVIGRPATTLRQFGRIGVEDPRTGETPTLGGAVLGNILPAKIQNVNLTTGGTISVRSAYGFYKSAVIAAGKAQAALNDARIREQAKAGELNTVSLMTQDPRDLQAYVTRLQDAQAKAARTQALFKQSQLDVQRTRRAFSGMTRTP